MQGTASVSGGALVVGVNAWAQAIGYTGPTISEKTLVSWLRLDNLDEHGGSALTIDKTDKYEFDGIVYAQQQLYRWMAGSDNVSRYQAPNPGFAETTTGELVQMAITYENSSGNAHIKIYRNGSLIGDYTQGTLESWSGTNTVIVFGARHIPYSSTYADWLVAHIEEARIYDGVLTQAQIQALNVGELPVELSSFTARIVNNMVNLKWQTATEVNNYGFNIERKPETGDWTNLGFVKGHGNSNSPKNYSFKDNSSLSSSKYYYRLKQIDNDGVYEYSKIIEVSISKPNTFALAQNYPNPFNPNTVISYTLPSESYVTLNVYNILGSQVASLVYEEQTKGEYKVTFDASNLSSGIYFYKLSAGNFIQLRKMILLK